LENGEKVCAVIHGEKTNDDKIIPYSYWDVGIPEDYKNANIKLLQTEIDSLLVWK